MTQVPAPTEWDDYLFDLQGYLVLKNVVSPELIEEINETVNEWVALQEAGHKWIGHVRCSDPEPVQGPDIKFGNIIEGGPAFEALIDNPNWIEFVKRYVDNHGLHIWMNFLPIIHQGNHVRLHSGGHNKMYRTSFWYHDDRFYCGNLNLFLALNDIGPGDGGTLVVPGSHKSNLPNPLVNQKGKDRKDYVLEPGDMAPYLREVHLKAGDAVLFTDALIHGASVRTNEGERRALIYRYSSSWTRDRFGYEYSDELVARLTPARRKIIRPIEPAKPPIMQMDKALQNK